MIDRPEPCDFNNGLFGANLASAFSNLRFLAKIIDRCDVSDYEYARVMAS